MDNMENKIRQKKCQLGKNCEIDLRPPHWQVDQKCPKIKNKVNQENFNLTKLENRLSLAASQQYIAKKTKMKHYNLKMIF